RTLAIIGAGVQGEHHLLTFPLVREFDDIRIASLYPEDAERLAAGHPAARATTAEAAVRGADVVALATHSPTPVIDRAWIAPGTPRRGRHARRAALPPPARRAPAPPRRPFWGRHPPRLRAAAGRVRRARRRRPVKRDRARRDPARPAPRANGRRDHDLQGDGT